MSDTERMPLVRKCRVCKKEFKTKPFFVKNGGGKYCSATCHHLGMRTGEVVRCSECGREIYKKPKAFRGSKSGMLFCDKTCQTRWRNKHFRGEKHTNWVHGRASYRTVLKHAGGPVCCKRCGLTDIRILAVHHIDRNRDNNKPSNLIWLCHNCHFLIHHDKVEEQKLMVPIV